MIKLQVVAAVDLAKKRKLEQLRNKKVQLRKKREDVTQKIAQDLHNINGEILKVKHDNKPGLKKKPKPAKKKTKSYVGKK